MAQKLQRTTSTEPKKGPGNVFLDKLETRSFTLLKIQSQLLTGSFGEKVSRLIQLSAVKFLQERV